VSCFEVPGMMQNTSVKGEDEKGYTSLHMIFCNYKMESKFWFTNMAIKFNAWCLSS
jgi:hypothetical protein